MAHRNRVDPFGKLAADPARGTLFGNRGVLHAPDRTVVRRHSAERRWIYCRLEFKGRRRKLLQPGRYTELFFLDEATALAAGHRPCAECMRRRFNEFRAAWGDPALRAGDLDAALHAERLTASGDQATWRSPLGDLPDGAMVAIHGEPHLWRDGGLLAWSFSGYGAPRRVDPADPVTADPVTVLTPPSTARALASGFSPFADVGQMSDIPES